MKAIEIKDIRPGFANSIFIIDYTPYYNGILINYLVKEVNSVSKFYYNVIQHNMNVGTVALTEEDFRTVQEYLNPIDFTSIKSDADGNPRCVCHFVHFIGDNDMHLSVAKQYRLALKRAKQFNGKRFDNKQYGGGIVFSMEEQYRKEMSYKIREFIRNL